MLDKLKQNYMVAVADQVTNIVLDVHEVRDLLDLFERLKDELEDVYYYNRELTILEDRIEELKDLITLLGGEIE